MRGRNGIFVQAALVLCCVAAPAWSAALPKLMVRLTSADSWRGYDRGQSAVALTSVTEGLFGWEKDGLSPYSVYLDFESSTPIDRRQEQGYLDEGRLRLVVEGPMDQNLAPFFGGAAVSYDVSDARDAHEARAAELSARAGFHTEGEPFLPTTVRLGVDHFTDRIHASRVSAELQLRVPVPSSPTRIGLLAAWSDYPEPGVASRDFGLHDLAFELATQHTLLHGITFESGFRAVHGGRTNMPTSSVGIFVGVRYGQRLSRSFDAWGL